MAYASIAGMPPETGLYTATATLLAYVIFGTSRRITVGPTAATAAVSASTIYPLAGGDRVRFVQLSVLLALLAGVFLVIGGLLRFGAIAKFLSGPVLAGFVVGVAIDIAFGQTGKLFSIKAEGDGFLRESGSLVSKLGETHLLTLAVGISSLVVLWGSHKLFPKFPGDGKFLGVASHAFPFRTSRHTGRHVLVLPQDQRTRTLPCQRSRRSRSPETSIAVSSPRFHIAR